MAKRHLGLIGSLHAQFSRATPQVTCNSVLNNSFPTLGSGSRILSFKSVATSNAPRFTREIERLFFGQSAAK